MTDWQPHEQLSADGSPAEDWTEPMIDATGRANTPVREMMDDAIHRARADAAGVDAGKLVDERVAELEAENERLRAALMPLETSSIASAVQEAAAATMQRDQLQAVLEQERRAVEALAEQCASQKPQRMPWMGCPVPAPDGYPGCLLGGRRPDCARCWAAWARARAETGDAR